MDNPGVLIYVTEISYARPKKNMVRAQFPLVLKEQISIPIEECRICTAEEIGKRVKEAIKKIDDKIEVIKNDE